MTANIALVKVSCINDRLIPLGLGCLQAHLKQNSVPVKVYNFKTSSSSLIGSFNFQINFIILPFSDKTLNIFRW